MIYRTTLCLLAIILFVPSAEAVQRPGWTDRLTPYTKGKKRYFLGRASLHGRSLDAARKAADAEARSKAGRELIAQASSIIDSVSKTVQVGRKATVRKRLTSVAKVESTALLAGGQVTGEYNDGDIMYIQVAFDTSELAPTPINLARQFSRQGERAQAQGDTGKALRLYSAAFTLTLDHSREGAKHLTTLASILEKQGRYSRLRSQIERYLNRHPKGAKSTFFRKELIRLSREVYRSKKSEADRARSRGDIVRALRIYNMAFSQSLDRSKDSGKILQILIEIYEKKLRYSEALKFISRYLNRHPNSSLASFLRREQKRITNLKNLQVVRWKPALGRLKELFGRHQSPSFQVQPLSPILPLGRPIKLNLTSSSRGYLHILWIDDKALYLYDQFSSTGKFPLVKGPSLTQLGSTDEKGTVTLYIIATRNRLVWPVKEVQRKKVEAEGTDEKEKFRKLLTFIEKHLAGSDRKTAVVKIRFE